MLHAQFVKKFEFTITSSIYIFFLLSKFPFLSTVVAFKELNLSKSFVI